MPSHRVLLQVLRAARSAATPEGGVEAPHQQKAAEQQRQQQQSEQQPHHHHHHHHHHHDRAASSSSGGSDDSVHTRSTRGSRGKEGHRITAASQQTGSPRGVTVLIPHARDHEWPSRIARGPTSRSASTDSSAEIRRREAARLAFKLRAQAATSSATAAAEPQAAAVEAAHAKRTAERE